MRFPKDMTVGVWASRLFAGRSSYSAGGDGAKEEQQQRDHFDLNKGIFSIKRKVFVEYSISIRGE